MIRPAVDSDVPRLIAMGLRFARQTSYATKLSANARALSRLFERLMASEDALVLVAERHGAVVGLIAAFAYQNPFSEEWVAGEALWWVEPEARGRAGVALFQGAETWARSKGVVRMHMIAPNERVATFYRRRGYVKLEETYQRDV